MRHGISEPLSRRRFLHLAAAGTAVIAGGGLPVLTSCDGAMGPDDGEPARSPLAMPATLSVAAASLVAGPGTASISGHASSTWSFNGLLPGPTLRARRGEQARIRLLNHLPEPTIVHWHGVLVPEYADGHPRYAIDPGAGYDYEFPIVQRAGTFWYHPHAHHRTAGQIQRGLAGFFIIADEEEDALGLPSGPREIVLMLQDRDGDAAAAFNYAPTTADLRTGMLRDVPFGNGVRLPALHVSGQRYRFRVLNASHARVYLLALDNGASLSLIGNDGGLLPSAVEVDNVYLGVGERVDFLVDFAAFPAGTRMMLKSLPFALPTAADGGHPQGLEMNLLELVRTAGVGANDPPLPSVLSSVPPLGPAVAPDRAFVFRSTDQGDMHQINGRSFDMNRVDEQIPLGQVERWLFSNDSALPHPVHLHGSHFQVESRSGGRNRVFPYEGGWKDTVLVMPLETVGVMVQFDRYRGIFPLHCHNLQHEDMGMMLNVEVI
ncbi:MAG: multicopper oxidase family protein [Gemmatimonadales bacterium]